MHPSSRLDLAFEPCRPQLLNDRPRLSVTTYYVQGSRKTSSATRPTARVARSHSTRPGGSKSALPFTERDHLASVIVWPLLRSVTGDRGWASDPMGAGDCGLG